MRTRTNITINPTILDRAQRMMAQDGFDNFSVFVEDLIRERWERSNTVNTTPGVMHDAPPRPPETQRGKRRTA